MAARHQVSPAVLPTSLDCRYGATSSPGGAFHHVHPAHAERRSVLLLLLSLFVASGAAALIYEVVWFHLLRFTIGSSTLSLGILLSSFMGGLCLGSLWYHRAVPVSRHPLRIYALIELGIGFCGILIPLILPFVTHLYVASAGSPTQDIVLRSLVCAALLLPPTILMGATLPAISRWMQLTGAGYSRLGFCYSANIVGAVIGTALAGFYLLRNYDVYTATAVAVSLNIVIAAASYALAARGNHTATDAVDEAGRVSSMSSVHLVIALSGFTALGSQVVWTRTLSLLLGATVYTFTVILTVFLVGLGAGGAFGAYRARTARTAPLMLAMCQCMLVLSIPYGAYAISTILPTLHVLGSTEGWALRSVDDVLRVMVAIGPATFCWGASFPLAVAAVGQSHRDPSKLVGLLYAANTIGAILGALCFSAMVIALIGTAQAQWLLTLCAGLAAALMLKAAGAPRPRARSESFAGLQRRGVNRAITTVVILLSILAGGVIPNVHPGMIAFGRQVARWNEPAEYLYVREGRHASIAVSKTKEHGYRNFHINGKTEASTWPEDLRLQRMLGHVPALLHTYPKSVLINGFGAGVTAGAFTRYPSIERIVIVEIEPEVLAASGVYFRDENYDVLHDPRTEVIYDDARHYITTTKDTFDLITTDPIHPWAKGSSALYTREFFELCRAHLNPGGFITQWVPFYETSLEAVKSQIGTFFDVFPLGSIWNSERDLKGYDVTLLGHADPFVIDADDLQNRLDRNEAVRQSLADVNIRSSADLLRTYAGQQGDVAAWLADYQPNLDKNLRLEYLAGEALDRYDEVAIYDSMTADLRYPDGFIRINPDGERALRQGFLDRYGAPDR